MFGFGGGILLSINTHFNPFRLRLSDKKPVELCVEIINRGDKTMMLTMEMALARQLSFDKSGIVRSKVQRIDKFLPGQKKVDYFNIYPKALAKRGEQGVLLRVMEHYGDWDFVERSHVKKLGLKVEE